MQNLGWYNTSEIANKDWTCGYCGCHVGGNVGYHATDRDRIIYICPNCRKPSVFIYAGNAWERRMRWQRKQIIKIF